MIESLIKIVLSMIILSTFGYSENGAMDSVWFSMTEDQRYESSIEMKANAVGMDVEEFDLMSRVIEAESDRSSDIEGRIMIALVLFNRVESCSFPNNITDVCYQSGQFEVVSNGAIWSVGRTSLSDWAIIEAHRWIADGDSPYVLYFNNSGYAYGTPYGCIGGNYFVEG